MKRHEQLTEEQEQAASSSPVSGAPSRPIQQLIAQWRKEAAESLEKWPRGAILPSKKLRQCADELEALLEVEVITR